MALQGLLRGTAGWVRRRGMAWLALLAILAAAPSRAGAQRAPPDLPDFSHSLHEAIGCAECHGTGEDHRTFLVQAARDCDACHHSPRSNYGCVDCHERSELSGEMRVRATMNFAVAQAPQVRELPFTHERHREVECRECHRTPVTMARDRECASCHTEHHRAEAECAQCHREVKMDAHDVDSHLSCSTGGCHTNDAGRKLELSRTLCLTCHTEQVDHEPGGDCAGCHQIPKLPEPLTRTARFLRGIR